MCNLENFKRFFEKASEFQLVEQFKQKPLDSLELVTEKENLRSPMPKKATQSSLAVIRQDFSKNFRKQETFRNKNRKPEDQFQNGVHTDGAPGRVLIKSNGLLIAFPQVFDLVKRMSQYLFPKFACSETNLVDLSDKLCLVNARTTSFSYVVSSFYAIKKFYFVFVLAKRFVYF